MNTFNEILEKNHPYKRKAGYKVVEVPPQEAYTYKSCHECMYYENRLIKSGFNPIREKVCTHPQAPRNYFRGGNLDNILGFGQTPNWCPVGEMKADE